MRYPRFSSQSPVARRTALAAITGACAAPLLGRGAIGQEQPLRLATAPLDVSAEPYYAMEMGFFKRAGLSNVTLQTIPTGAAMTAAVAGGAIDIAISNIVSVAQAYQRNVPFTLVAPAGLYSSSAPTSILMVAKDSPLRTAPPTWRAKRSARAAFEASRNSRQWLGSISTEAPPLPSSSSE